MPYRARESLSYYIDKNMKRAFFIISIAALCYSSARAQLIINEFMQSNIDCLFDDLNEFPDSWVELYNAGSEVQTTASYKIGLTDNPDHAWQLTARTIAPGSRVVVYCDKEATGLHTDFRLESGKGGAIYLFQGDKIVDSLTEIPKQPDANIAYGRKTDGSSEWGWMAYPSPNTPNRGALCEEILGEPMFSIPGQVFENQRSVTVSLSLPEDAPANTIIRYTLDGSEPTDNSTVYTKPITITSSKNIRAKLCHNGYLSPRSTTHSYILFPREMTLPVISIATNNEYFYDNSKGICVDGTFNRSKKNYQYDWRRPINLEFFEAPGKESELNQLCETRVSGGASRGCALKSLAIYANKRFGKKHFKYEFFPDQRPGLSKYKSLVLRNAGNDFDYLYMRDIIAQRTMAENTDIDWQAWRPAIVYINGTYKGILNIRERGNENNIYTNYDELEDIDLVENWNDFKEGDSKNMDAFKAFYNEHGHTWDEYSQWIDLEEFINIWGMNSYFNNIDFPANNCMMWRPRTEDGRWRFIAKDVDYILGLYNQHPYNYKYLNWLNDNNFDSNCSWGNTYDATRLFRRLLEDEDFKREFIDRMAIYMGDFLNYDRIWQDIWSPMRETIKAEYPHHRKLFNEWWPNYDSELSSAQSWLKSRTSFFYQHLASTYSLGTPTSLIINQTLSAEETAEIIVDVNGVPLTQSTFDGKFFTGRELTITANENSPYTIDGWKITQINNNGSFVQEDIQGDSYSFFMPNCKSLMINAKIGKAADINEIGTADSDAEILDIFDLRGIRHSKLQPGMNIVKMSNGKTKKILF